MAPPRQKRFLSTYQECDGEGEGDDDYSYEPDHQRRRRFYRPRCRDVEQNQAPQVEVELQQQQPQQVEELLLHHQQPIHISSDDDSDESETDPQALDDFCRLVLSLQSELREHVQCPVCLGIFKNTRVVMECQHRFCKTCIELSIRSGKKECPTCRVHCPSRRSLRNDPDFDSFIQAVYPDADNYVEQELVLDEEDIALRDQFRESFRQVSKRQAKASPRRRKRGRRRAASLSSLRVTPTIRTAYSGRLRRNTRRCKDDNNEQKSSASEHGTQMKLRSSSRRQGAELNPTSPPPLAITPGVENMENSTELAGDDSAGAVVALPKLFSWGKGGVRSHTRHGCASSSKITKLVDYFQSEQKSDDQLNNVHLKLDSLDKETTPSLEKPYISCRPSLSVDHLREHIAHETKSQTKDIEIVLSLRNKSPENVVVELQALGGQQTLGDIKSDCTLTLGYVQKKFDA